MYVKKEQLNNPNQIDKLKVINIINFYFEKYNFLIINLLIKNLREGKAVKKGLLVKKSRIEESAI